MKRILFRYFTIVLLLVGIVFLTIFIASAVTNPDSAPKLWYFALIGGASLLIFFILLFSRASKKSNKKPKLTKEEKQKERERIEAEKERQRQLQELIIKADSGDSESQYLLAKKYQTGDGLEKSLGTAIKYFTLAAEAEHSEAMISLAVMYSEGEGVIKDQKEAVKWLLKADKLNNPKAMRNLGTCYYHGMGVTQDLDKAKKYYKKGAELGDDKCMLNLGIIYFKNAEEKNRKKDYNEAFEWFNKAADKDLAEAISYVGICYEDGLGVEKDLDIALKHYKKAADKGYVPAQYNYGRLCLYGVDVKQRWYGDSAWVFYKGLLEDAISYLSLAKKNGDKIANEPLQRALEYRKKMNALMKPAPQQVNKPKPASPGAFSKPVPISKPQYGNALQETVPAGPSKDRYYYFVKAEAVPDSIKYLRTEYIGNVPKYAKYEISIKITFKYKNCNGNVIYFEEYTSAYDVFESYTFSIYDIERHYKHLMRDFLIKESYKNASGTQFASSIIQEWL